MRISAGLNLVNLDREGVDIAVRYCATNSAGPQAIKLFGEVMTPVCSPALRKQPGKPLKRPEDLQHHTLLHTDGHGDAQFPDWSLWLRAMQIGHLKPAGALHFSDYDQMMNAAMRGQGVALGRIPLINGLIKERKLVALSSARAWRSPMGYHLLQLRRAPGAASPRSTTLPPGLLEEAAPSACKPGSARF